MINKLNWCLLLALVCVVYQILSGKGSIFRVRELETLLVAQNVANDAQRIANEELSAEIYSLENRREAIEERARRELYMVRNNEILFRLEMPEENAARQDILKTMPDFRAPDIKPGEDQTFQPKKSDLYFAPKNKRAPKARDRRE